MAKYFKITTSSLLPTRAGIGGKTFLMHQYKNKFMGNRIVSKSFTCRCQPIEYLGYQIHRYSSSEQHIVKDGTCVAMRMSVAESMVAVDEMIIHQLILDTNDNTLLGMAIVRAIHEPGNLPSKIIEWVKSQAADNPELMYNIIGKSLTIQILKK